MGRGGLCALRRQSESAAGGAAGVEWGGGWGWDERTERDAQPHARPGAQLWPVCLWVGGVAGSTERGTAPGVKDYWSPRSDARTGRVSLAAGVDAIDSEVVRAELPLRVLIGYRYG